jgi:hypothetical protein
MQFGAYDGSERLATKLPGIDDWVIEPFHEVIGDSEEVVSLVLICGDHLSDRLPSIGPGRMRVKIPAPEPAGLVEWQIVHWLLVQVTRRIACVSLP